MKPMTLSLSLLLAAMAAPVFAAPAPNAMPGEKPIDPYVASNANAGATRMADTKTFEAFNGVEGISRVVDEMVRLSVEDPKSAEIFKATDLPRLRRTLKEQFCYILAGPCDYTGRDMKTAHKDIGLQNADMNLLVEHLQTAMDKERIPFAEQNKLLAKLAPMKRDVVER